MITSFNMLWSSIVESACFFFFMLFKLVLELIETCQYLNPFAINSRMKMDLVKRLSIAPYDINVSYNVAIGEVMATQFVQKCVLRANKATPIESCHIPRNSHGHCLSSNFSRTSLWG